MQIRGPVQASLCLIGEPVLGKSEPWSSWHSSECCNAQEVSEGDSGVRRWRALRTEDRRDVNALYSLVAESKAAGTIAVATANPSIHKVTSTLCIVRRVPQKALLGGLD